MLQLKGLPAGRFLWQLGAPTVDKLGLFSLQNCAFCVVDKPSAFAWTFDALMLGSGVGFNIQRENVYKLPKINKKFVAPTRQDNSSADFIVPDSREGWTELLNRTIECAFGKRESFSYSTQLVRGKGAPIKGFGGVASGPEELVWGIAQISSIIESKAGKQLRPVDCLDIMNIIGHVVVSGNVRRSAQIAIGDYDDLDYLKSKRWDLGSIPNWRAMSNNSVVCDDTTLLPEEFWAGYSGQGEPFGLININLAQTIGRTGETQYPDHDVQGFNPCVEQPLADKETCCLAEMFLPLIKSYEELTQIAKLLYRICKHSLRLKCHSKDTERVVHKNMRMGIGITGYLQAWEKHEWLAPCYDMLREYDKEYSKAKGWPVSIKLTTCKPSGTLSLGPGVTPGCHPGYAQHMIRRIRISSNHSLVDVCRSHGYPVEPQRNFDGSLDTSTMVVEFPFSYPEGTTLAKDMTASKQLDIVRKLQAEWSDNGVSCTVYYKKEELPEIKEYLARHYKEELKAVSFLLHSEHGFDQAPYEEISKEEYDKRVASSRLITSASVSDFESLDECSSGHCPIR